MPYRVRSCAALLALFAGCAAVHAFDFSGTKEIRAHFRDQGQRTIGNIHFTPATDGSSHFEIEWRHDQFQDYFLSMREFKCLKGPDEIACLVPYPHRQPKAVTQQDLSWLEHNLMFMFKLPSEFGARLWNGMYFQLRDDGHRLVGPPLSIDLNLIAAPPDSPGKPPYEPPLRSEMDASPRWLHGLSIE